MGIRIKRAQRDAIYQEVVLDLNGLTDLWTDIDPDALASTALPDDPGWSAWCRSDRRRG